MRDDKGTLMLSCASIEAGYWNHDTLQRSLSELVKVTYLCLISCVEIVLPL